MYADLSPLLTCTHVTRYCTAAPQVRHVPRLSCVPDRRPRSLRDPSASFRSRQPHRTCPAPATSSTLHPSRPLRPLRRTQQPQCINAPPLAPYDHDHSDHLPLARCPKRAAQALRSTLSSVSPSPSSPALAALGVFDDGMPPSSLHCMPRATACLPPVSTACLARWHASRRQQAFSQLASARLHRLLSASIGAAPHPTAGWAALDPATRPSAPPAQPPHLHHVPCLSAPLRAIRMRGERRPCEALQHARPSRPPFPTALLPSAPAALLGLK